MNFLGAVEFGVNPLGYNALHGTPRNPHDTSRLTGGSSSGTAAIIAAGICPISTGAAFASLQGLDLKPKPGLSPDGLHETRIQAASLWPPLGTFGRAGRRLLGVGLTCVQSAEGLDQTIRPSRICKARQEQVMGTHKNEPHPLDCSCCDSDSACGPWSGPLSDAET